MTDSLVVRLEKLIEDWKLLEGAYYNDIGDAIGNCARALENLLVLYNIECISLADKDIEDEQ